MGKCEKYNGFVIFIVMFYFKVYFNVVFFLNDFCFLNINVVYSIYFLIYINDKGFVCLKGIFWLERFNN